MGSSLKASLEEIATWDRVQCLHAWEATTGIVPAARLSTRFLQKALAFEAQCKAFGGHSTPVRRTLRVKADAPSASKAALTHGAQLVREWNGRVYRVRVTRDGFDLDGRSFRSLSAVAKHITGAEWSGPRFFGLKKAS